MSLSFYIFLLCSFLFRWTPWGLTSMSLLTASRLERQMWSFAVMKMLLLPCPKTKTTCVSYFCLSHQSGSFTSWLHIWLCWVSENMKTKSSVENSFFYIHRTSLYRTFSKLNCQWGNWNKWVWVIFFILFKRQHSHTCVIILKLTVLTYHPQAVVVVVVTTATLEALEAVVCVDIESDLQSIQMFCCASP